MSDLPRIELHSMPHPTDSRITCDDCDETFTGTVAETADWIQNHLSTKHMNPSGRAVDEHE